MGRGGGRCDGCRRRVRWERTGVLERWCASRWSADKIVKDGGDTRRRDVFYGRAYNGVQFRLQD